MYGVEAKVLNQAVKRNISRFPPDFMFQLSEEEWNSLRSQIVTSKNTRGGHHIENSNYKFYDHDKKIRQIIQALNSLLEKPKAINTDLHQANRIGFNTD